MAEATLAPEARAELLARWRAARAHTDALFRLVTPEGLYVRTIPERHRLIFYLGHLEAFDWNLVGKAALGLEPFQEEFDRLFAFGIDPVNGNLPTDRPSDWPSIEEVQKYNQRLQERLDTHLRAADWADPKLPYLHGGQIMHVALEHRWMHAETLVYLIHHLPLGHKLPPPQLPPPPAVPLKLRQAEIPAGKATLGLERAGAHPFGWDNEFDPHTVDVPPFAIDAFPVTNAQYLDFLRAGGYQDKTLWSEAGWQWKQERGLAHPHFWTPRNGQWSLRARFADIPLPSDWPVYVSYAEASAYARWAGKNLPSEAQWHRAAYGTPPGNERLYPWGNDPPEPHRGNFDFARWDPTPVTAHPAGGSAFGVHDLLGNGWEWTRTVFAPFPGFHPFPFYPGYSANFFDGKHYVMKGGSMRTAACLLRRSFRNWFQFHYPYVPAKFRLVKE